ncbi:putative transposase [Parasphingopyxis lamellibrachiae]|uniref:Putative transposase n=1 Tax=Parasphingopyxis lamellibrachiae TaxID=680125 RepID=A0A3D9F8X9_9SPHN|nr:putative transposase [Parasphingopyxis lamellibrachiae]
MEPISFDRHRFPPEIIRYAVWLYAKFTLSFRDVEDLLVERGLDVSYETVRRWCLKFGPTIARNLKTKRPAPSDHWHLDEMVMVIRGRHYWLWRGVDNEGEVLDFLVQSRRNTKAAEKLMRSLLRQHCRPTQVTIDKLRSYCAAFKKLASTGSKARAKDAAVQITWISTMLPQPSIGDLKQFLLPASSARSGNLQTISGRCSQ